MAKNLFARYIWELTTIYRAGRITLKELNERWQDCYLYDGKDIPRRTFDYHRKEIEMLFNLNIMTSTITPIMWRMTMTIAMGNCASGLSIVWL